MPSSIVKKKAREALSIDFAQTIVVSCVLLFSFFIIVLISSLVSTVAGTVGYIVMFAALMTMVFCPLALGVLNFFRRLAWNQKDEITAAFKYFSTKQQYKRAMKFVLLQGGRYVIAAAILYSPCVVVWLLSNEKIYSTLGFSLPVWASNLWTLNSLLGFISTMIFVFVTLKYYLSSFIFVSNDNIDVSEAINMSGIISRRTGADYFGVVLSFSGWILLGVLVLPLMFVLPYFLTAYAVHCHYAITSYNKDVDTFNSINTPSYSVDEI